MASKAVTSLIVIVLCTANLAFANPFELPANEHPQIRSRILQCEAWLTTPDQVDDSVGIPFGTQNPEQFEKQISRITESHGLEKFRNGTFYITGVPMRHAKKVKAHYEETLDRHDLKSVNAKVVILSAPSRHVEKESIRLVNHVELFLKQMMLSAPFVINYSVLGHLSEILNFYAINGWQKTLEAFPYELSHFVTTQGLTLAVQTIFYSQIITKGFGGWVDSQTGDQNTRDARTLRPILQTPLLAADSVFLMLAADNSWQPLLSLGLVDFNAGQAGILAMTAASWLFFKKFPKGFNKILHYYQIRKAKRT